MLHYYKFKDITKNPLLQENRSAEFCPLFQEIPVLQDTLLRESTVLSTYVICVSWTWIDKCSK